MIREGWLRRLVDDYQVLTGMISVAPGSELISRIEQFAREFASPASPLEALLLRGLTTELAIRLEHTRASDRRILTASVLDALLSEPGTRAWGNALGAFARLTVGPDPKWADSTVQRAKALLDEAPVRNLSLGDVSRELRMSSRQVSRTFKRSLGISPHQYLTTVRVRRALQLLARGQRVASVGLEVGYRSKKSLYQAIRRVTGKSLAELRATFPAAFTG